MAVGGVVANHFYPGRLPGGYAGVDVFFVISGFLISSHLISKPPRTAVDLLRFWARRIRRLLPAALLVLAVTLIASRLLAPETAWQPTARAARAAALYSVNWQLAHDSVNYWAAGTATPVQHFWSLSVEEQFYLGWPLAVLLVFLLVGALSRRQHGSLPSARLLLIAVFGAVFVLSLVVSIHETHVARNSAYFMTWTRAWEFAVGALLAAVVTTGRGRRRAADTRAAVRARALLAWVGLAAIVATFVFYDDKVQFPGWVALLPTIATVLIIAVRPLRPGPEPAGLLALPPVQWVGNVSYSLYLWHWPALMLLPYLTAKIHSDGSAAAGRYDKIAALAVSLVLAELTRRYVENPVRFFQPKLNLTWVYAAGAAAMALVVVGAVMQVDEVQHRHDAAVQRFLADMSKPCVGAAAAFQPSHCPASSYANLVYSPAEAAQDPSWAMGLNNKLCQRSTPDAQPPDFLDNVCQYGDLKAKTTIVLAGNSHALQWLPAVNRIALAHHWRLVTLFASGCVMNMPEIVDSPEKVKGCSAWGERSINYIVKLHPALVLFSAWQRTDLALSRSTEEVRAHQVLARWAAAGVPTIVIHDLTNRAPQSPVPACVATHQQDFATCGGELHVDPMFDQAKTFGSRLVKTVDFSPQLCPKNYCQPVIGDMIVYFDWNHLTASFSLTMAPYLDKAIKTTGLSP